ncbi:hypothetical protein JCM10450v2_006520 [Rhodotorula kratochvilovae]
MSSAAALHDRQELLTQVIAVYDWLRANAGGHNDPIKRDLFRARAGVEKQWGMMLPQEREEAVDLVLGAYCTARGHGDDEWKGWVKTRAVNEEIGYQGAPMQSPAEGRAAVATIQKHVKAVEEFFGEVARTAANSESLKVWSEEFFGPDGINATKLRRVEAKTCEAMLPILDKVKPSAYTLLFEAHLATQSSEDRFHLCCVLLEDLVRLYRGHFASEEQLDHLKSALDQLEQDHSLAHFATLPREQQNHVVHLGRSVLYEACQYRETHAALPDARTITHHFFGALLNRDLVHGGARNPIALAALGRALRQISDRKARRYYGTTARAWIAGRAGAGW